MEWSFNLDNGGAVSASCNVDEGHSETLPTITEEVSEELDREERMTRRLAIETADTDGG